MRAVIQRVSRADLSIDGQRHAEIGRGMVVLLAVGPDDTPADVTWLAGKFKNLRIFSDHNGRMNHSVQDIAGSILLVSQFTLFANTRKGNRPSFMNAASPQKAKQLYALMERELRHPTDEVTVKTGVFGADMQIELVNDGPVTLLIDSKTDF